MSFIALTLSARAQIPFYPVPLTLQTLVVLMLGAAYGGRLAAATVALYLVEGALGLPVFAGTPVLAVVSAPVTGRRITLGPMGELMANLQPVVKCKPANIPAFRLNSQYDLVSDSTRVY